MKHLSVLLSEIKSALIHGGSSAARHEADEQIVRRAEQGTLMANEDLAANEADFARQFEEWYGIPPEPRTPREDPNHMAKARKGRIAERILLVLKMVFWAVFAPGYFTVSPWLAALVAISISVTLSLGVKPFNRRDDSQAWVDIRPAGTSPAFASRCGHHHFRVRVWKLVPFTWIIRVARAHRRTPGLAGA